MKTASILMVLVIALLSSATAAGADARLPDWSGWWGYDLPGPEEYRRNPPPLLPHKQAERDAALRRDYRRSCYPPQFVGHNNGFVAAVEFLFTSGRVTLTNEGGLIRRIYTDGRRMPADPVPSNTGSSTGHWDGDTLVVETTGITPTANFPGGGQGDIPIGRGARITERFRLVAADTIEQEVVLVAPEILSAPYRAVRVYRRLRDHDMAREWSNCVADDRAVDPVTGGQRFDMTPPEDLPPPPRLD
jgi:hypothetical protein